MESSQKLRGVLESQRITPVAIVQDALTTRLAQIAGFPAVVLASSGVSNALLAMPDSGLVTLSEMEFVLARAAAACEIPILVDGEAGFGSAVNVVRTIRTLERAGAGGAILEDQENPPRASGGPVVSTAEMAGKVTAAADARRDDAFVLIARTDAREREGLDAAIERGRRYVDAGADGFFVAGLKSLEEVRRVTAEVPARVHLSTEIGAGVPATFDDLEAAGLHAVIPRGAALRVGASASLRWFRRVLETRTSSGVGALDDVDEPPYDDWKRLTGSDRVDELERRYVPTERLGRLAHEG